MLFFLIGPQFENYFDKNLGEKAKINLFSTEITKKL